MKALKTILVIGAVACGMFVLGLAGGSDAGTVGAGQALLGGMLGVAGCIGCAWASGKIMKEEQV